MTNTWAVVDGNNVVLRVECASDEWVASWETANADASMRYLPTDVEARDYAGIGWEWDDTRERFIPPMPDTEGRWVYDEEAWGWIDLDAPPPPEPEPTPEA